MKVRYNLILLISFTIFLFSCAGEKRTENSYTVAFTVRDAPAPFTTMAHGGPHLITTTFLFDTLVWKNDKEFVPLLAEKWESTEDKKTWTFTLRSNVKWHDGKPFTAEDVKFTFDYLTRSPLTMNAGDIKALIEGTEAQSPTVVVVKLKESAPDFLNNVAGQTLILPKHIWESVSDPFKYQENAAFVGTGPFKFKETRKGEFHVFDANPDYFLGKPVIDQLILKNANNAVLGIESGDIDAASPNSPLALTKLKDNPEFEIVSGPYSYYLTKLVFNVNKTPFSSKDLRHAVAYSLNRPEIVKQVLNGEGIVSSVGILHPDSPWFAKDLPKYEQDLARAEALFAKAGFGQKDADGTRQSADGTKLSFTLYTRSDSQDMVREAEMVRDQLGAVGIRLDIKPLNTGPQENVLAKGEFDIALDSHGGTNVFSIPATNPDFPAKGYKNEETAKLYKEFLTTLDESKRREVAGKIQHIIADDLPALTMYNPATKVIFRKSKGIKWFWTKDGLAGGAPIWWNKLALLK